MRDRNEIGSEYVTSISHYGKVLEQSVGVGIRRQVGYDCVPEFRIAQRNCHRHTLFEATVRILAHPIAHTGESGAKRWTDRNLYAAFASDCVCRERDRLDYRFLQSQESGLKRADRDRGYHALR